MLKAIVTQGSKGRYRVSIIDIDNGDTTKFYSPGSWSSPGEANLEKNSCMKRIAEPFVAAVKAKFVGICVGVGSVCLAVGVLCGILIS